MEKEKLTVYKSNKLIEARYASLTHSEQLLLLSCIGQIDPRSYTGDVGIVVTASEFADLANVNKRYVYEDLKKTADRLYNRSIVIDMPDPDMPELTKTKTRWVHSCDYFDKNGKVVFYFSPKIMPYITQLTGAFTKYKLNQVSNFKSKYGIRLYELLVQWQSADEREIDVDWIRERWELNYPRVSTLKAKVIIPAMEDINNHSDLWVKFSQRKQGKVITHFQFKFGIKAGDKRNSNAVTVEKFVQDHPQLTTGKTVDEVIKMMKEHNNSSVDENQKELFN